MNAPAEVWEVWVLDFSAEGLDGRDYDRRAAWEAFSARKRASA